MAFPTVPQAPKVPFPLLYRDREAFHRQWPSFLYFFQAFFQAFFQDFFLYLNVSLKSGFFPIPDSFLSPGSFPAPDSFLSPGSFPAPDSFLNTDSFPENTSLWHSVYSAVYRYARRQEFPKEYPDNPYKFLQCSISWKRRREPPPHFRKSPRYPVLLPAMLLHGHPQ